MSTASLWTWSAGSFAMVAVAAAAAATVEPSRDIYISAIDVIYDYNRVTTSLQIDFMCDSFYRGTKSPSWTASLQFPSMRNYANCTRKTTAATGQSVKSV